MALAAIPTKWVHMWLVPLKKWLDALKIAVDGLLAAIVPGSEVQTTDANATTLATVAVPTGKILFVEVDIAGDKSDHTQGAGYVIRAAWRNVAGVLTQVSADEVDVVFQDDATWGEPSTAASGANVLIKIVGKAATTINWNTTSRVTLA